MSRHELDACPSCAASLIGDEIPEHRRYMYSGRTHGSRRVAIYDRVLDRTTHWQCPDCGHEWERTC